ncbi:MAG: ABC transporter ATP-binding protein [Syntrophomonadaceae bacterium]|jgi:energy-coupling factor transport system ATP-binding protein|nr:ABC transporter ATP-binding protein [Syntrophomonadaceae bacterium]
MDAVIVKDLSYQYWPEGPQVLKNISFQAARGEMLVITGLSGCGKSTLCYCLSGIAGHRRDAVMQGQVLVNGKDVRGLRAASLALEAGMVFQDPDTQLFSPSVEDEIAFGPENLCLPPDEIRARVDQVLDLLDISSLIKANPYHLSGGEKHLVALAAVLALDPPVLILDEVMSRLDRHGVMRVTEVLQTLRNAGKTIIAVEHRLETVTFADRLMVMEKGALLRWGTTKNILADQEFLAAQHLLD